MKKDQQGKDPATRRWHRLALGCLLGVGVAGCNPGPPETTSGATPADFFAPIRTIDPDDTDFSDLEGLGRALAGVEVVLLGEPIHGSNTGVSARARLVRFLHSRVGFSILAYESSFYGSARAWEDAQSAADPQTILADGVHPGWSKRHGAPLFRYLASEMKSATPLRLAGVDPAFRNGGSPEKTLRFESEAIAYLASRDCASPWTAATRSSMVELADLDGEATAGQLARQAALLSALESSTDCLASAPGWPEGLKDEFWQQVFANVDSLARSDWGDPADPGLRQIRDRAMADNVAWLRAHHPGEKIIVWAANLHNARTLSEVRDGKESANPGERPMGEYLSESLGNRLFSLMTTSGEYVSRRGEREHCVPADRRDVLEGELENRGSPAGWVNLRAWKAVRGKPGNFVTLAFGLLPRRAPWGEVADGFLYLPTLDAASATPAP
jgi:erythromycin esterase-like protein